MTKPTKRKLERNLIQYEAKALKLRDAKEKIKEYSENQSRFVINNDEINYLGVDIDEKIDYYNYYLRFNSILKRRRTTDTPTLRLTFPPSVVIIHVKNKLSSINLLY